MVETTMELSIEDQLSAKRTALDLLTEKLTGETDVDQILIQAGEVTKARSDLQKLQKDANKGKISAAEDLLIHGIQALAENTDWYNLTGEGIHTIVWYIDTSQESEDGTTGPVYGVRINPARAARRASSPGTGQRRSRSTEMVTRTLGDGSVEQMTVKEAVNAYATDTMRETQLFEPKKAWGLLFPKLNKQLAEAGEPEFEDAEAPAEAN